MKLSHWDWNFNATPCNYKIKKVKASSWSFVLLYSLTQSVGRWTFDIPRGSSVHHNIHHFVRLKTLDSRFGIPIENFHCSTISQCLTAYCWEMSRVSVMWSVMHNVQVSTRQIWWRVSYNTQMVSCYSYN